MTTAPADSIRRSVEVEYWVIDSEGRLTDPDDLADAAPGVEREFVEPLLEIKTSPCETAAELHRVLLDRIGAVLRRADELDMGLVPLSTPLCADEIADRPGERTRIQAQTIGPAFEYVRHCAGTHIHFEQQPGSELDQLNTLIALDPALALVNSSRHFRGEHLAAGARSKCYRRLAYADLDHQGQLWPYVSDRDEWDRRLDARFEEFIAAASRVGIDRSTVTDCFDPESAVWTPVKLREAFGTVEWRAPDTALPSQILQLAETMAALVEHARTAEVRIGDETGRVTEEAITLPEFETVTDHVDCAIEDGLASPAVRSYLTRMGFDPSAYEPVSASFADAQELSPAAARALRLDHAERLRSDVLGRHPIEAD